jgi:hypothetical protein
MPSSRKTLAQAFFKNRRGKPSLKWSDFDSKPKLYSLHNYMAEITIPYYEERRQKLGRAYSVAGVTKLREIDGRPNSMLLLIEIKALSTTLKQQPIVGFTALQPLKKPSLWYTLRFMVRVELPKYLAHPTIANLRKEFKDARCMYFCNCMMFNFSGANYRARDWSLYPQRIPDPRMRRFYGAQSKVCKHIAHCSIDFNGIIPEIHSKLKSLI